jgi:hypothetical protein
MNRAADQSPLAVYAVAGAARCALLLKRSEETFRIAECWDADDQGLAQARLVLPSLLSGRDPEELALPIAALSTDALLSGQLLDPHDLIDVLSLDSELADVALDLTRVSKVAAIPIGPRATLGLAILGLENDTADIEALRLSAGPLSTLLSSPEAKSSPLALLAENCSAGLARLYRLEQEGLARVVAAWDGGRGLLPDSGESLSISDTPLATVLDSEDVVLVATGERKDWLSTARAAQGWQTALYVPLFADGRVAVVVELAAARAGALSPITSEIVSGQTAILRDIAIGPSQPAEPSAYELVRSLIASPGFLASPHVDRVCLEVIDEGSRSVRFVVGGNDSMPGNGERAPFAGSASEAVLEGSPALVDTRRVNGWFNRAMLAQGFPTVLRVPIREGTGLLGVLSLRRVLPTHSKRCQVRSAPSPTTSPC